MPAVPLDEAGQFVAAAYAVFLLLLVVYVGIMAAKLGRISREISELVDHLERRQGEAGTEADEAGSGTGAERSSPTSRKDAAQRATPAGVSARDRSSQPAAGSRRSRAPIQEERW